MILDKISRNLIEAVSLHLEDEDLTEFSLILPLLSMYLTSIIGCSKNWSFSAFFISSQSIQAFLNFA